MMNAQPKITSPAGEYLLEGIRETASGFQLKNDSTFQFFFSYGALDRFGEGRWKKQNDSIVFESKPKPMHDFKLVNSAAGPGGRINITLKDMNPMLLQNVYCRIKGGGREQEGMTDKEGVIQFSAQTVDTIEILFEFTPEKSSVFGIAEKNHRSFEFAPEPWLMEVFFHNFQLELTKNGLNGGHPLSDKTDFKYRKN
jgi:hypothetical protein